MSTNENTPTDSSNVSVSDESLDDFAAELFGESKEASGTAKPEDEPSEEADDADAPEDNEDEDDQEEVDTQSGDDDTPAPDEDDEDEDGQVNEDPKPAKKKNRFQERIDELTAKAREAERALEAERQKNEERLAALEAKLAGNKDNNKADKSDPVKSGPNKNDLDEDGKPKYPLGEYDPKYMRDMVEHMLSEREAEQQKRIEVSEQERQRQAAKAELQKNWNARLVDARERYPDFQEKGLKMLSVFEGIDEQYGEYLTNTIMEMEEAGPDVFYYLSSNVDEAKRIVEAGPKKATIALAKLEAKLADGGRQGSKSIKATKAKTPPPRNKGSAVSKPAVDPDTDDLAAFERQLFRK